MGVDNDLIKREIQAVINSGAKPILNEWRCTLLAGDQKIDAYAVIGFERDEDYYRNYSAVIVLEILIPLGTYRTKIEPFDQTLMATLWVKPMREGSIEYSTSSKIETETFAATIIEQGVNKIKTATPENTSTEGADHTRLHTVRLQLMNPAIRQLRMMDVGGVYRNTNPGMLLRHILGSKSVGLKTSNEQSILGVDVDVSLFSNKETLPHILIPHPTPIISLPSLLQLNHGIYSTGCGFYLHKQHWYIWPVADCTRFEKAKKTLTVVIVPPDKFRESDRTYRTTEKQVIVLANGAVKHFDNLEQVNLNEGNGARFTVAANMVEGFGKYENGKYTVNRKNNTSEFLTNQREDGLQKVTTPAARFTANPFAIYSAMAMREVTYVQFEWQNSNPSLFFPGMPTKVVYEDKGVIKEAEGVLFTAQHFITADGNSKVDSKHRCKSAITVLIKAYK